MDIDTDFSAFAREYALAYVTETYGERAIAGIMTKAVMGPLNALTYAPKLYAIERGEDSRSYAATGAALRSYARECKHLSDIEETINEQFGTDSTAMTIFSYAKMIEGYITSYGQHAAGVIALQKDHVEDYIPLLKTSGEEKLAIQADMIQAEGQLGFLKFDFLGLKNLNIYTVFMRNLTAHTGIKIDPYKIPLDDRKVYEMFAKGYTNFIFQFESDGMKKMLTRLKPSRFIDLVIAVAVYRPGPMEFIDDIILSKNTGKKSPFLQKFPQLGEILDETYGYPIFQEQVMKIAQVCAGWSLGKADNLRRCMSKKNEEELAKMRPEFIEGCMKNGISKEDADWLFDKLMPFAKYGFNKSHAAAYTLIAYITAYAKCYYPAEYLCAAMTEQGNKTLQFVSDCKRLGIEVKRVDINKSGMDYMIEGENVIRIGFSAIKGLKADAASIIANRADGPYTSIKDFLARTDMKISSYKACVLAGACDDFTENRLGAMSYLEELSAFDDEINKCEKRLKEINAMPDGTEAEQKAKARLHIQWENKLDAANAAFENCSEAVMAPLSTERKLAFESEYLGMWTTGSPLEDYDLSKYKSLDELKSGRCLVAGVITSLRVFNTKAGSKMATFTLIDKESTATSAVVFPNQFEMLMHKLKDNAVVEIRGSISYRDSNDENGEEEKQIIVDSLNMLSAKISFITIIVPKMQMYPKVERLLLHHKVDSGCAVRVLDWDNDMREVTVSVSESIVADLDKCEIEYSVRK